MALIVSSSSLIAPYIFPHPSHPDGIQTFQSNLYDGHREVQKLEEFLEANDQRVAFLKVVLPVTERPYKKIDLKQLTIYFDGTDPIVFDGYYNLKGYFFVNILPSRRYGGLNVQVDLVKDLMIGAAKKR